MKKIARCPHKLILFGEHSVLNNSKCIALCINKYGELFISSEKVSNILVKDLKNQGFVFSVNKLKKHPLSDNFDSIIKLNYHLGCGLGSSAVISLLSSVALYYNSKQNWELIYKKADEIEDYFHFKSSGVDIATIKTGGLISFQSKNIEHIDPQFLINFDIIIYNSNISKDTGKTILMDLNEKENNYIKLGKLAEEAYNLIKYGFKLKDFYDLVKQAQKVLEDLGVVPDIMKKEVRKMREKGIECKLTGAGNGGHLFTLVERGMIFENWERVNIDLVGLVLE
ncbi:mevalonate kinase [Vairimorpha apis BRL 01]|uniref:Mevalonate kinase n=1 Tax=Vairimorpha apis BRL 01 TaxID=1037528 RepID=T0MC62_9MICR|nr:mevalonate kinase [Vairimorpha apis BRL 01]